jgi:hypothetical protein
MKSWLALPLAAWLAGASALQAQMMGGGRDLRAGREVMNERLASPTPGQRSWLDAVRDERAGSRTVSQRITLRAGFRSYRLGSGDVEESLAQATYTLRRPGMRLNVAGGPLRFESGDSLAISGVSPFSARLDLALGELDSVRVALRAPSSPRTLSGLQAAALASVATSTVDLSSVELGTPPGVSARYARALRMGASASISGTLGLDYEPRPGGSGWSYWRGTTVRAGLGGSLPAGSTRLGAGIEVSRSFSDSLQGRNLFQGGGSVLGRAMVTGGLGANDRLLFDVSALYFRPFAAGSADGISHRTPTGDFIGASAIGLWRLADLLVTPALVIARESARGAAGNPSGSGSSWAIGSSLGVDIGLGGRVSLTPEAGWARGSLPRELGSGGSGVRGTASLSGWWLATDISFAF